MKPRIVFMGSPEFALPTLEMLAREYAVAGVVTQPDKPAGRGRDVTPPVVKTAALALGLPVLQPATLKDPAAFKQLAGLNPDLIIVAAFGQILRQDVLDLPPFGCINVHASLLPRWRGAAPIQAAILNGDEETGVTIMRMEAGLDTGPILAQRATPIEPGETGGILSDRLAILGANLLRETLPAWLDGSIQPVPQDESQAAYAPRLKKDEGFLVFSQPVTLLERRVRAFNPWPGTFFLLGDLILKIHKAHLLEDPDAQPGRRVIIEKKPAIGAAGGWLVLDVLQPAGRKPMPGEAFLSGARDWLAGSA